VFMTEKDPLNALLRKSKSPDPGPEFDDRVLDSYRAAFPIRERPLPVWRRLWSARVSVPLPFLLAGVAVLAALLLWFRPEPAPSAPTQDRANVVTRLNATGFVPLPNGAARVVSFKEGHL
jgi:hypothetical protein